MYPMLLYVLSHAVVFNASKRFTGILLQSDVGSLPAPPNQGILPRQNLAPGPCDTNTISQRYFGNALRKKKRILKLNLFHCRSILNVDSIQVGYKAPDFGAVTFRYAITLAPLSLAGIITLNNTLHSNRYTVVFRYNESLVNKKTTFLQCPVATTSVSWRLEASP